MNLESIKVFVLFDWEGIKHNRQGENCYNMTGKPSIIVYTVFYSRRYPELDILVDGNILFKMFICILLLITV